jgi:hypothetical protein
VATDDVAPGMPAESAPKGKVTSKAMPDGSKGLLITSLVVLLGSLTLFLGNVVAGFVYFTAKTTPLWVTVLGVVALLGMAVGFGGVCLVFLLAVVKARREDKAPVVEQQ